LSELESKAVIIEKNSNIIRTVENKAVIIGKNSNIIRIVENKAVILRKEKGYCQNSRKTEQLF
jgi:hypothetical protein